jgi:hypothetical protein
MGPTVLTRRCRPTGIKAGHGHDVHIHNMTIRKLPCRNLHHHELPWCFFELFVLCIDRILAFCEVGWWDGAAEKQRRLSCRLRLGFIVAKAGGCPPQSTLCRVPPTGRAASPRRWTGVCQPNGLSLLTPMAVRFLVGLGCAMGLCLVPFSISGLRPLSRLGSF